MIGLVKKDFCSKGTFSFPAVATPVISRPADAANQPPLITPRYSTMAFNIMALTTNPSSLTVRTTDATLTGFAPEKSPSRYWEVTETGELTATMSFHYLDGDVDQQEADYRVWRKEGTNMPTNECAGGPCVTPATNLLGPVSGVTLFSKWTGGGAGSLAPTAAGATLGGRILTADGRGIRNAIVTVNGNVLLTPVRAITGAFGYYQIENLEVGETYVVTVSTKQFTFLQPSRVVSLTDSIRGFDFVARPQP